MAIEQLGKQAGSEYPMTIDELRDVRLHARQPFGKLTDGQRHVLHPASLRTGLMRRFGSHRGSNPIARLARASVGAASSCAWAAPSRAIAKTAPGSARIS